MDRDELLTRLAGLRRATTGGTRAPHKPLLLLWLFGRFVDTGSTEVSYAEAADPVGALITEFGPPVRQATARDRAAMPFVHLERELWDLRDDAGNELDPDVPERPGLLLDRGVTGRLRPGVERLLADPDTLAAATRLLLDRHFTPVLADLIRDQVGLNQSIVEEQRPPARERLVRPRDSRFTTEVLRAYDYRCAMCRFDGALGNTPVGLEAAHVRWYSQRGPNRVDNGLALCALHHALLDLGVLGLTPDHRIRVSDLYTARSDAGRAVNALAGQALLTPRSPRSVVDIAFIDWHATQVFKAHS